MEDVQSQGGWYHEPVSTTYGTILSCLEQFGEGDSDSLRRLCCVSRGSFLSQTEFELNDEPKLNRLYREVAERKGWVRESGQPLAPVLHKAARESGYQGFLPNEFRTVRLYPPTR
jgi:hypothetical protein